MNNQIFNNPLQKATERFFAANIKSGRPYFTPPEVIDSILDDDGNTQYVLANGNTVSEIRYNAIWHPVKLKQATPDKNPSKYIIQ